ncbi:DUF4235 domain-containing protein [Algoriphagus machipongonensis]|uniref:DUF4235 domain-containing protein n=1 Tax=Algoriphagus machipongonensis TaxID=388413 RepID=A3HSL4_9BACT|nr:DUF4235 domain-containing protein [Algoriphagus machipongonensis]EAZ82832.1 hypothetical protein ALPR1_11465 [Algoriphagus machipongonensis]
MNLSKNKFTLLSTLLTVGVAALAKTAVDNRYEKITGKSAPKNPETDDASLGDVILYTAITAAVGMTVKLLVRKFFTKKWKKLDGEVPKHLK